MNLSKFLSLIVIAIFQLALVSGCSTQSALMMKQVEQNASDQQRVQQVLEALKVTESRLAKAQSENVEIYAPKQMDEASRALIEVRRYSDNFQANPEKVNSSISLFFSKTMGEDAMALIAKANDALDKADDNKKQADTIFAEANENFIWLKKFEAPIHFRSQYRELEGTQQRLIDYVADGKADAARNGLPRLLQGQRALEVAAAQRFYLYELSQKIERYEQHTVNRYAPLSYSNALAALNQTRTIITKNPRDRNAIITAKNETRFTFAMAKAVAADMYKLADMNRDEMERWLILLVTKLHEMGQAMGATDVRNHKLAQQVELLADSVKQDGVQLITGVEQVVKTDDDTKTEELLSSEENSPVEEGIQQRMTQLEQSLAEQIKALSEQLKEMKATNKSAQAPVDYEVPAPISERKSLFGN